MSTKKVRSRSADLNAGIIDTKACDTGVKGSPLALFGRLQIAVVCSIVAAAIAIAALGLALANSSPAGSSIPRGTVDVTGTATINARPDTLMVNFTVQVIRSSSNAALRRDNSEMSALQKVFRRADVPAKDLSTSNLTVGQNFDSNGRPAGYMASNSLTVTLTDLGRSGALISSAQSAVGNDVSINNISYSLVNVNDVLDTARATAVRRARNAATVLAKSAGSAVNGVVKITDQSTTSTTPIPFSNAVTPKSTAGSGPPVPLRPGTQPVTATVDVVFSLSS